MPRQKLLWLEPFFLLRVAMDLPHRRNTNRLDSHTLRSFVMISNAFRYQLTKRLGHACTSSFLLLLSLF